VFPEGKDLRGGTTSFLPPGQTKPGLEKKAKPGKTKTKKKKRYPLLWDPLLFPRDLYWGTEMQSTGLWGLCWDGPYWKEGKRKGGSCRHYLGGNIDLVLCTVRYLGPAFEQASSHFSVIGGIPIGSLNDKKVQPKKQTPQKQKGT